MIKTNDINIQQNSDDDFFEMLNRKAKTKSRIKKLIIIALILATVATGGFFLLKNTLLAQGKAETIYREYSLSKGDLTVGLSESSSVSLSKENITMPVSSSIEEIYVKSGQTVKVGDPLFKYNVLEASEPLEDYLNEISEQKILLDKEILQIQNKLKSAEQSKDFSNFESDNATLTLNHTLDVSKNNLETKQNNVDSYNERLVKLEVLANDIEKDIENLEIYQINIEYYEGVIEYYKDLKTEALDRVEYYQEVINNSKDCDTSEIKAEVDAQNSLASSYQAEIENNTEYINNLFEEEKNDISAFKEKYGNFEVKEDVLEEIDSVNSSLEKAQIDLEGAKINYGETVLSANQNYEKTLLEGELANSNYDIEYQSMTRDIENAQKKYDDLVEEYDNLKSQLSDDGIVYSQIDGFISSFSVEVGDTVKTTTNNTGATSYPTILTITKLEDVLVPIDVTEEDILDVFVGQEASVTINAYKGQTFDAVVESIEIEGARVGAATVTYTVNIALKDKNTLPLMEGMTCEATLINAQAEDVIYIESQAIIKENGISYVNIKGQDGEPIKTEIKTGFTDGKYTEIKSGVKLDDIIMIESALGSNSSSNSNSNMPNFNMENIKNTPQNFSEMRGSK